MYKVFLSSTSTDLSDYREAVHRAIDGLAGFQLITMEDFGARGATPRISATRLVRESDLLVGLMGHYYGSRPPNERSPSPSSSTAPPKQAGLPQLSSLHQTISRAQPISAIRRSFKRQQAIPRRGHE